MNSSPTEKGSNALWVPQYHCRNCGAKLDGTPGLAKEIERQIDERGGPVLAYILHDCSGNDQVYGIATLVACFMKEN